MQQSKNLIVGSDILLIDFQLETICLDCKEILNGVSLINLNCGRCIICKQCLYKKVESELLLNQNLWLFCQCRMPISYDLFKGLLEIDHLINFITKISQNPKGIRVYNCKCRTKIVQLQDLETTCSCGICLCTKCLQTHNMNIDCLDFFFIAFQICKFCYQNKNHSTVAALCARIA